VLEKVQSESPLDAVMECNFSWVPAPVTVPVNANVLAKLILSELIASSAKAPAGNVLSAMLYSY
jgi:hypothetical protein